MIGCVHLSVGAAIGVLCSQVFKKVNHLPVIRPVRTLVGNLRLSFFRPRETFALLGLVSLVALGSHFVCDHFQHLEYRQMGLWAIPVVMIDLLVAGSLYWYVGHSQASLLEKMAVVFGMFWSALPDGIYYLHEFSGWQMLWAKSFLAFHRSVHTPTPSSGIINQLVIVLISLWILSRFTYRRSL